MDKESRLLTDEETEGIYFDCGQLYSPSLNYLTERLRQAQDTKSVKAIIEWGAEPCPHWADVTEKVIKRDCGLCWQALKRSIDEKQLK